MQQRHATNRRHREKTRAIVAEVDELQLMRLLQTNGKRFANTPSEQQAVQLLQLANVTDVVQTGVTGEYYISVCKLVIAFRPLT